MAKVIGACLAVAAVGWAVHAQQRIDVSPGAGGPMFQGTQEQSRRALVENCVSTPDLQQRLTDIRTGRETAVHCAEERRNPGLPESGLRMGGEAREWPDRYLLQVQGPGGEWRRSEEDTHSRVEPAWDAAVKLCEQSRPSGPTPRAVKIADSVTGLERVIDCRAPLRR